MDSLSCFQNNELIGSSIDDKIESNNVINKNDLTKVFVGNVPYQCTQDEFEKCFERLEGYVKAEIITGYRNNISRGFGFVTMQTIDQAEQLKRRNDIIFKNRILRFTPYRNLDTFHNTHNSVRDNNYVNVDMIPIGWNKRILRKAFSEYEPIGKCYINIDPNTGELGSNGFIEIYDDEMYEKIILKQFHEFDGNVLQTTRYHTDWSKYTDVTRTTF